MKEIKNNKGCGGDSHFEELLTSFIYQWLGNFKLLQLFAVIGNGNFQNVDG